MQEWTSGSLREVDGILDQAQRSEQAIHIELQQGSLHASAADAILDPARLTALKQCDTMMVSYDPESFAIVLRFRGRNMAVIAKPLVFIMLWSVCWAVVLWFEPPLRDAILPLDSLINPLLTPVSFLLVFRLSRAAVRYWDARAAAGKLIETCRSLSSTAIVYCSGHTDLQQDFCRLICVFPISVKNFLRPNQKESHHKNGCERRVEVGALLSEIDATEFLHQEGCGPIFVLNKLRQLTMRAAVETDFDQHIRACVCQQLLQHIDTLTSTWGAMERINSTPLPFAYVAHLRTFLIVYLLLWSLQSLAQFTWSALGANLAVSLALLGIEAAAVGCERPFERGSNHLKLGNMCVIVSKNVAYTFRHAQSKIETTASTCE